MYHLLLEKFNNYNNRILKKFDTVQEYVDYQVANSHRYVKDVTTKMNFNKKDNIYSSHIFNDNLNPDYCIWIDETTGNIVSRWFVIRYTHTSGNQYLAILKHDVLADNKASLLLSPAFIEKGYVDDSDPAVYNRENMTFNQIKTSEYFLKDASSTAWIVGYIADNHTALTGKSFTYNPEVDLTIASTFESWSYASLVDTNEHITLNPDSNENKMRFVLAPLSTLDRFEFMFNGISGSSEYNPWVPDCWEAIRDEISSYRSSNWYSAINWTTCLQKVLLDNPTMISRTDFDYLKSLMGKKIQFSDGIYTIEITEDLDEYENDWKYYNSGNLYNYLYGIVNSSLEHGIQSVIRYPVAHKLYIKKFRFRAVELTNVEGTYTYSLPQSVRSLSDAPYKMFCMPYYTGGKEHYYFSKDGSIWIDIIKDLMMTWALDIARQLGSGLYDLQILPYCPISEWEGVSYPTQDRIWIKNKVENTDYVVLKDSNDSVKGYCVFCDVSTKELFISQNYDAYDYKINNETSLFRLCSPNYASVFEFSLAKNKGVYGFNVRFTYKPFNPFINVAPNFNGLYGKDFKDNRGLICSGDFSLPIVNSAWINYQLNNKNYLLAFDRQIENMETNYYWERLGSIFNVGTGIVQGGTMGGMAGGMAGGPYGAVAGAIIGTASSSIGGAMDLKRQSELHSETKDFAYDNFGYQLGNIKALPNTLNKVSSIVANYKFFPFMEYYTCTDVEKEALRNKLKYNGMTIMRIGTISQFLNPDDLTFIKCQLIRNEDIACSSDEMLEIYNELEKGVFI